MPTSPSSASVRARACFLFMPMCRRSTSPIWKPTVNTGLSDDIGSWKIIEMSLPHIWRRSAGAIFSRSRPSNRMRLAGSTRLFSGASKPMTASELTDLPLPDSPTSATVALRGTSNEMPLTASKLVFLSSRKETRRSRTCSSMLESVSHGARLISVSGRARRARHR